jgi:small subunit ribosomal protein S20
LTRAQKLIAGNEIEAAQQAVVDTISALDRDAKKRVIHRNTAARRKSRLMKKFNKAKLSGTAQRKTDKA